MALARKKPPRISSLRSAAAMEDSGDNRLSRQRHYHRPGGLNGRVRNGNGCDPASMVTGKVTGGRSSPAGHGWFDGWSHRGKTHQVVSERVSGEFSTTLVESVKGLLLGQHARSI